MDEAINGPGEIYDVPGLGDVVQYDFGVAGSAVVNMGEGSQDKLPDVNRKVFKDNQLKLQKALARIAGYMDASFAISSHEGCGWAGAQAIKDVALATKQMCKSVGATYAGHIEYGNYPQKLGNTNAYANISRHPHEHKHTGRSIVVSVGGGITPKELANFEKERYGDAFVISADFAAEAIGQGWMSAKTATEILAIQLDLADGLANREINAQSILTFDAGRLSNQARGFNERIFDQAVASLTR